MVEVWESIESSACEVEPTMSRTKSHRVACGILLVWLARLDPEVGARSAELPGHQRTESAPATPTSASTPPVPPEKSALAMSPAVACLRVEGLDQYTLLPEATLTSADKLKVYFRPLNYKFETDLTKKSPYRARFVEDGQIRRKGEKAAIAKEDKLLEYETRFDSADYRIYLVNTIGLESFKPGEYELDITLHDMIDGQATAKQSISFRIIPGVADLPAKPAAEPTKPSTPKKTSTKPGRSPKRPG